MFSAAGQFSLRDNKVLNLENLFCCCAVRAARQQLIAPACKDCFKKQLAFSLNLQYLLKHLQKSAAKNKNIIQANLRSRMCPMQEVETKCFY